MLTSTAIATSANKFTPVVASIATVAGTTVDVTPLPSWVEAGVLGLVVLALGYTVRYLFNLREQDRKKYIERLEDENTKLKQQQDKK